MSELRVIERRVIDRGVPAPPASRAEALLRAGIPLSLLLDLASGDPHSDELYALEHAS